MSSTLHLNCSSSATTSSSRMQGSRCPQCPTAPRRLAVVAAAGKASSNPRTSKLRERLKQPGILQVLPARLMVGSGGRSGWLAQARRRRTTALTPLAPVLQGPCCHDGLSARLIERAGGWAIVHGLLRCVHVGASGAPPHPLAAASPRATTAGFQFAFMSGFCTAGAR